VDSTLDRLGQTLLGKWRLDALVGEGGMAAVYAATHRNGSRGAVKMLHSSEADEIIRFSREGYIANHVDHPAIVRALDDDVAEDGTPFLVMELLDGKSLDALASEQGGQLSVMEVLRVMREVLDALVAAHSHGIVHRDIKPENIFVTVDGRVKVLDFGIAHLPQGTGPCSPKTQSGLVMGTPNFMSPEQARARWELVGPASDVWAVGATMFRLLSGQFVHLEETLPELLAATFTNPARSLREVMPNAAQHVIGLVDRALELSIADRWASAEEMHQALLEVEAAVAKSTRPAALASLASTLPPPRKWPLPSRGAVLGALDLSSGVVMLVLSAHCWAASISPPSPMAAGASVEVAALTVPDPALSLTEEAVAQMGPPAPPESNAEQTPLPAVSAVAHRAPKSISTPPSTSTSHEHENTRRNIYDRRY
jgi:serine/threonine-protein kinase